ncbi:MAG TPA: SpoIIE family protein phosphatase [Solirubrobacteraceae bacterium]|jgi:serine phosphatase RsbU (regulator of sigma subunit)/DNA-binding response OmpR family regulator/anti-sigma regulatory factor (Ser/Thr protein kinase)|nr:SpoIIE family protein phosphatase [Solirubrobacteraceae bacterium]
MLSMEVEPLEHRAGILLVDDHPENLTALEAVLEPLGEPLVTAESGEQALRALLREEVAVILLDVRMAGMDGLETAQIIRSRPRTRHIPIIFLTAQASDVEDIALAYATGAVDYVVKPFEPDVLRAKVSAFVELSRERAERVRQSRARAEAEAVAATVRKLQIVSDAALAHLELDELLTEILERATTLFDADAAGVLLCDDDGHGMSLRASQGEPFPLPDGGRVTFGEGALGRLANERRPALLAAPELVPEPDAAAARIDSALVVPLLSSGNLIGLLYLGAGPGRRFGGADLELLALAGERVAIAIEHAQRYAHGLELVELLQRNLLPESLPTHPLLELAARYRPSGFAAQVGGDWYDALVLDDMRIGVMIGDIVGHGIRAATTMGELRSALRAFAIEGHPPGEALRRLDRVVQATLGPGMVATVMFLILDADAGTVTVASAGHPPPAIVGADGRVRFLETTPFLPLGVDDHAVATERVHPLAAGDTLLLYTDGLVERRDESIDVGFERLRSALRDAPKDVEALCDHVLDRTLGDHPGQDDVAVLTVRLLAESGAPLALTLPATTESVTVARHRLRTWLGTAAPELEIGVARDLELAWSEACTNAVRHAYGPGDATFSLRAERAGEEIVLEVRDYGSWREPLGDRGGWGLRIIRAVCDEVEVERGVTGTRVRMRQWVRPQSAATGAGPTATTSSEG